MYIEEIKNTHKQNIGNLVKKIHKNKNYESFIINATLFLCGDISIATRLFYIRENITEQLKCKECNKLLTTVRQFCCNKCSNVYNGKDIEINKSRGEKTSNFYKNISKEQLYEIQLKIENTNIERYGNKCSLHGEQIKIKKEQTWLNNGYTNPNKSEKIREKIRNTCNELYGGDAPTSSPEIIKKRQDNCYIKYGVNNPMQLDNIKQKCSDTYFNKTGFKNPSHNPEIIEKIKNTFFKNDGLGKHKTGYRYKVFKSENKLFYCQGYEIAYLMLLLKSYKDIDIENSVSYMRTLNFEYTDIMNKKHIYIPDFFILKENLIIEVKSEYFLKKDIHNILLKAQSVIDKNYNYILVYSQNGTKFKKLTYENIKNYKENLYK